MLPNPRASNLVTAPAGVYSPDAGTASMAWSSRIADGTVPHARLQQPDDMPLSMEGRAAVIPLQDSTSIQSVTQGAIMKLRTFVLVSGLACASVNVHAQLKVIDPAVLAQAGKQVKAWGDQYQQMRTQIDTMNAQLNAMTGNRGMATLLPHVVSELPPDWAQAMTQLSALARQIKEANAVLTPEQATFLSPDMQTLLAQMQDVSAANKAMAETAYKSAAARHSRLHGFTDALAATQDPKAAYDLANRIAIEHAALLQDQNQLIAAANAAAVNERDQKLRKVQMRAAAFGTAVPRIDTSLP